MGNTIPYGLNYTAGGLHLHFPRAYLLLLTFPFIYYNGRRWKSDDCQINLMWYNVL